MTERAHYARAKAEFERLSELTGTGRDAAIAAITQTDPALAQELRRLFQASAQGLASLDAAPVEATPRFPRYRVIREIGRGGMGRVWLGERDDGSFRGQVAIKQIYRESWNAADERRFLRERQILATLDPPHIARLIDGGHDEHGRPFLATWFVDGQPITRYCEAHALDLRARLVLLRKLGDAVGHAHRQLVVHRDIKPANILVDSQGEPRLLDFGIAAVLDADSAATTAGAPTPLTLRYAAPEQILGERAAIACDIHALGCLMYELIAGEPPHADAGAAALMHAIVHDMPPAPSATARRLGRTIPSRDLDAICLRALRKRPQERYLSVDDWNADIGRALAGEPVQARRGERGYAARRWLRRRWPWLAAASLLLALVSYHLVSINRQLAAVARERDRAEELADFTITVYQSATPAEIREEKVSALGLLDRAAARLEDPKTEADQSPATRAAVIASLGHVYYEIGVRDRAARQFERALALFETATPLPEDDIAVHQRYLAMALYGQDRAEEALEWIERALARRARLGDTDSDIYAGLIRAGAVYASSLEQMDRASDYYDRAIESLQAKLPQSGNELSTTLGNAANLDLQLGRLDQAEQRVARAREHLDPSYTLHYRTDLFLRRLQAKILGARGRYDQALPLLHEARDEARRRMGENHPDLLLFANDHGVLLTDAGRLEEAGPAFDEALAIAGRSGGGNRRLIGVRAARARWLLAQERYAEAAAELTAVLAERDRTPQRDRRSIAHERVALAYARCRLGQPEAADELAALLHGAEARSITQRQSVANDFARWQAACAAQATATQAAATPTAPPPQ